MAEEWCFKRDLVPVSFLKDPNAPVEPILPKSSNVNSTGNRQFVSHGDFHEENLASRSTHYMLNYLLYADLLIQSKKHWKLHDQGLKGRWRTNKDYNIFDDI